MSGQSDRDGVVGVGNVDPFPWGQFVRRCKGREEGRPVHVAGGIEDALGAQDIEAGVAIEDACCHHFRAQDLEICFIVAGGPEAGVKACGGQGVVCMGCALVPAAVSNVIEGGVATAAGDGVVHGVSCV